MTAQPTRSRLWAEFVALYAVCPLLIAVFLPPRLMFPALFGFTALGLILLSRTDGFRWQALVKGPRIAWGRVVGFTLVTALASAVVIFLTQPDAAFGLMRHNPALLLMIFALYPILSALPQELIFRALFFGRYGALLPPGPAALALNAAIFSFAHLMYWSWVVTLMTFAGGLVFAAAYAKGRSFPLALILHSLAGCVIFAFGLGVYFYSGNVVRPF